MRDAAANLEFEEAGRVRDEIRRLQEVELAVADDPLARQSVIDARVEEASEGRVKKSEGTVSNVRSKPRVSRTKRHKN
jgi:excinuclease ABC subunit B